MTCAVPSCAFAECKWSAIWQHRSMDERGDSPGGSASGKPQALSAAIAEYEAEFGVITEEEIAA